MRTKPPFQFKQFSLAHDQCAHKVGTDGVLLGAWTEADQPQRILDVGTGSGLVALMLAQRFPAAQVRGIELDAPSAQQARENARQSPFAERVSILEGDFLQYHSAHSFDLIVSNPPFFVGNTPSGKMARDRARHAEHLPQTDFLDRTAQLLSKAGQLAVILPREEAQSFLKLAEARQLYPRRILQIHGNEAAEDKRWILQLGFGQGSCERAKLTLRDSSGNYSETYRQLTRDFHPNF